mgnify:CR=1 FL=1
MVPESTLAALMSMPPDLTPTRASTPVGGQRPESVEPIADPEGPGGAEGGPVDALPVGTTLNSIGRSGAPERVVTPKDFIYLLQILLFCQGGSVGFWEGRVVHIGV